MKTKHITTAVMVMFLCLFAVGVSAQNSHPQLTETMSAAEKSAWIKAHPAEYARMSTTAAPAEEPAVKNDPGVQPGEYPATFMEPEPAQPQPAEQAETATSQPAGSRSATPKSSR